MYRSHRCAARYLSTMMKVYKTVIMQPSQCNEISSPCINIGNSALWLEQCTASDHRRCKHFFSVSLCLVSSRIILQKPNMLCDKCQDIHFKPLQDCEVIQQEPERLQGESSIYTDNIVVYFHHRSKDDLKASADWGCHFCAMLWGSLFEGMGTQYPATYHFAGGDVILRRSIIDRWIGEEGGLEEWNSSDWIYIYCNGKTGTTTSRSN